MVAQSWESPEHWYQTNVVAQVKLHDRLRELDFLEKYVHVSTPEVYGTTDGWVTENFDFTPSTPYAVSRAACDLHLRSFHEAYGFPVVFTRAANVYGPGQQLYRIIPKAMLYARTGRRLKLEGGGRSIRSFIHIDDVVDATRRAAIDGTPGATYHVSTTSEVSIRELVEQICEMTGVAFGDLVEVADDRLGKDRAYRLDAGLIREQLGWNDRITLGRGLAMTLEWVDAHLPLLSQLPCDYEHKQ
jgi:dTDP-glucose 4,6-dehydratase